MNLIHCFLPINKIYLIEISFIRLFACQLCLKKKNRNSSINPNTWSVSRPIKYTFLRKQQVSNYSYTRVSLLT